MGSQQGIDLTELLFLPRERARTQLLLPVYFPDVPAEAVQLLEIPWRKRGVGRLPPSCSPFPKRGLLPPRSTPSTPRFPVCSWVLVWVFFHQICWGCTLSSQIKELGALVIWTRPPLTTWNLGNCTSSKGPPKR